MTTIGYVGLGAMGGSLAGHLAGPFDLVVLDRSQAAMDALVGKGARQASDGAELGRLCDVVILCLPRTADVRDALFAPGGIVEGLSAGKLVIDQTSGIPGQTATIAAELAERGIQMMDAPVSGGIPAALAGQVTIIASGSGTAWSAGEAVLRAMTQKVYRCSDRVGDAQALKLVNNAIGMDFRMMALELAALGRKSGLGLAAIVEQLNAGPAANFTTRNMLAAHAEGRSTTNFALALMHKDLSEGLSLGLPLGAAMPMTSATRSWVQLGLNRFGPAAKLDDVIPLVAQLSGIEMRGDGAADRFLLSSLETALVVGNALSVSECVAMGHRHGLKRTEMARILNVGSAWCEVSETILPALAEARRPEIPVTLGQAADALVALSALAGQHVTTFVLPGLCLALVLDGIRRHGRHASLGVLTFGFED